ncbi:MAG: diguanylate cyclase [Alphaproteobacteria bacterium]|nr:diguanylate cyclase [Alphaproteobacteria bacterium]
MFFWELPEKARELHTRAHGQLEAHGIAPTPLNYELWFFHELGQNDDLKSALDQAVRTGKAGDIEFARALHGRFFRPTGGAEEIDEVGARIATELKKLADALQTTGEGSAAYGRTLGDAAQKLAQSDVSPQLRQVIDQVAAATVAMAEKNRTLRTQVDASAKEVQSLRSQVDTLRKEGQIDALTGLVNRRGFDERIAVAVSEAKLKRKPMSLLMCDIDHFKRFNDTWGHATGDQVLRLVAQCIRTSVRDVDTAARYGGEEMTVILPETGLEGARTVAEKIRKTVEARRIVKKSSGESLGSITLSIGVCQLNPDEGAADFIARTDACLYAAKSAGRNRISSEAKDGAWHDGTAANARSTMESGAVSGHAVLETSFNDDDTPVFFDTALDISNARLKRFLLWWQSLAPVGHLPQWSQGLLAQIAPMREFLHGSEVLGDDDRFQLNFFGRDIVRAFGSDPAGRALSREGELPPALRPILMRMHEGLTLVRQLKAPVHSFAKAPLRLPTGLHDGESLAVPFHHQGRDVGFILTATLFSPASANADRRRVG